MVYFKEINDADNKMLRNERWRVKNTAEQQPCIHTWQMRVKYLFGNRRIRCGYLHQSRQYIKCRLLLIYSNGIARTIFITIYFLQLFTQVAFAATFQLRLFTVLTKVLSNIILAQPVHAYNAEMRQALEEQRAKDQYGKSLFQWTQGIILKFTSLRASSPS